MQRVFPSLTSRMKAGKKGPIPYSRGLQQNVYRPREARPVGFLLYQGIVVKLLHYRTVGLEGKKNRAFGSTHRLGAETSGIVGSATIHRPALHCITTISASSRESLAPDLMASLTLLNASSVMYSFIAASLKRCNRRKKIFPIRNINVL